MSDAAMNDASTVAEAHAKLTWRDMTDARKQAVDRLLKAGGREALANVLAAYLPEMLNTHLAAADYRQQFDAAVTQAVDEVKKWEEICSGTRRTVRVSKLIAAIEDGTYRAPRKRRKARKRKVSK